MRPSPSRSAALRPFIVLSIAGAIHSAALGQVTPQPEVLLMERVSVVGPGQVDVNAPGSPPLTETARGRFSELPWISPDGRFVVFTSAANTLDRKDDETAQMAFPFTGPDDRHVDVYLIDRSLPPEDEARVRRLSRLPNGGTPNQGSSFGVIDDAASIAVFQSKARNLLGASQGPFNTRQLFMVDLAGGGFPSLVSQNGAGDPVQGRFPAISGDGKYVFFSSDSQAIPKPGPGSGVFDANVGDEDVFRYGTQTGDFAIVTQASNRRDGFPAASFDGGWVAIESEREADVLTGFDLTGDLPGDTDADIFLVNGASDDDSAQPPTFPVSLSTTPSTMGARDSRFPAISHDGRFVAFVSWADDLVVGDDLGNPDTFLRDMGDPPSSNTGPTVRVSVGGLTTEELGSPDPIVGPIEMNDAESGCAWGCRPSVVHIPGDSANPGVVIVAYVTLADFDTYDTNSAWDVYIRVMRADDLGCWETYLVSAPAHGSAGARAAGNMASFNPHLRAQRNPADPSTLLLRVAFESYSTNLDPSVTDANMTRDIYYTELIVPVPDCP